MIKNSIKNACLVIIGNEILTGRTQDKNINHIAKELFKVGILLSYVCVIPDFQKIIIKVHRPSKPTTDFLEMPIPMGESLCHLLRIDV